MDILKKEICFLSRNKIYCTKNQKNSKKELILSPCYYWHFERKLPVTSIKRAKKIIPQILKSSLPNKEFKYIIVQKEKKIFDIFVLDIIFLKEKLNYLDIPFELVSSISFSHIEFKQSEIKLDDSVLISNDDYSCEISSSKFKQKNTSLDNDIRLVLSNKEKLEYKYSLGGSNWLQKGVDFIDVYFKGLVLLLLILILSQGISVYSNLLLEDEYNIKKQKNLSSQKYATHEIQLSYVMNDLLDLDAKHKKFKSDFDTILNIKSNGKNYVNSIEYDNGHWLIYVKSSKREDASSLLSKTKLKYIKQQKKLFVYENNK